MKLICLEDGIEFEAFKQSHAISGYGDKLDNAYCLKLTGKVYIKCNGTAWYLDNKAWYVTDKKSQEDTHRAICFLEAIEKPMPQILAGDYVTFNKTLGDRYLYVTELTDNCVKFLDNYGVSKEYINKVYRNGKLIWSKS